LPLARAIAPCLALFRPDWARRVSLGIAMNNPPPASDPDAEVPQWVVPRAITPETMRAASKAVTAR
jgi:hypothetical protein